MKDLDELLPLVMERAPACPEPTALRYLRKAALEFCRRTRIWRCEDTFEIPEDGKECMAVEPGTLIYEITHARFVPTDDTDGFDLVPVTIDYLDENELGWRTADASVPQFITQSGPNTVRLYPAPEDGGDLTVSLILLPATNADLVPDVLVDSYSHEIADGALGEILVLPQDFADLKVGAYHAAKFNDSLGRFSDRVQRGQQRSKRRVTPAANF